MTKTKMTKTTKTTKSERMMMMVMVMMMTVGCLTVWLFSFDDRSMLDRTRNGRWRVNIDSVHSIRFGSIRFDRIQERTLNWSKLMRLKRLLFGVKHNQVCVDQSVQSTTPTNIWLSLPCGFVQLNWHSIETTESRLKQRVLVGTGWSTTVCIRPIDRHNRNCRRVTN